MLFDRTWGAWARIAVKGTRYAIRCYINYLIRYRWSRWSYILKNAWKNCSWSNVWPRYRWLTVQAINHARYIGLRHYGLRSPSGVHRRTHHHFIFVVAIIVSPADSDSISQHQQNDHAVFYSVFCCRGHELRPYMKYWPIRPKRPPRFTLFVDNHFSCLRRSEAI